MFTYHEEGNTHLELVSHLFWDCDFVLNLWQEVRNWFSNFQINIPLDRKILLFGFHNQSSGSVQNYTLLCVKYYIWITKFQTAELCFQAFLKYFKTKLEDIKNAYSYQDKDEKFEPWLLIYNCLVLQCLETSEATMPTENPTDSQSDM